MEPTDVVLLIGLLMLVAFVLGASIMWSLEGRDRRAQPLWLVITRYLMMLGLTTWTFFGPLRDGRDAIMDPAIGTVLGILAAAATVLAFGLELRARYGRNARAGSGRAP
jgi:hypothetical protein